MDKKALWKWLLLVVLVCGSLATVLPLKEKVRLGLDLRGGTSFTVQIDEEALAGQMREEKEMSEAQIQESLPKEVKAAQERAVEVIRNRVDGLGIAEPVIYPEKHNRIIVQLPGVDEKKREEARKAIQSAAFLEFRLVHENNRQLVDALFDKGLAPEGFLIASVNEPGSSRNYYKRDRKAVPDEKMDWEFRRKMGEFHAPRGYEFMLERPKKIQGQECYEPCFVQRRALLSGNIIRNAKTEYGANVTQPEVGFELQAQAARKFRMITEDYAPGGAKNMNGEMRWCLAIVLDGTLYSAPYIKSPIPNGKGVIEGNFTVPEVAQLVNVLRSGSLPAPVKIVEQRTVDPTLGADSIHSGVKASLIGMAAVVILMAAYYLLPGLIANFTLILNVVLLPLGMVVTAGIMGLFATDARTGGAIALPVLTLPGIAGIALSVGMAVDANVLIFERMREEMRVGKGLLSTIQAGFTRAFSAIFDSNITTIITAFIMFVMGSGPIRGYAVTLTAGLIINLYTAVMVARMCFNWIASRRSDMRAVRMMEAIKQTNFDFMKPWKLALGISMIVIVGSWAVMVYHGKQDSRKVFGVDFTGGSAITLSFTAKPDLQAVRSVVEDAGIKDSTVSYQSEMDKKNEVLVVKVGSIEDGAKVGAVLAEKFPAAGFKVMQQDDVGPQVGAELKGKAVTALLVALVAMVIYIWIRFELGFGVGAVVALFHDVLVTAGVCHLLGVQMSMTVMAALLTIVGYSVNDTIVIFDRIRENLRSARGKAFVDICNQSMNETLSRTILTNFLTFVTVICLLVIGGGAIKDFSVAMFIGMISGTYSTVYIATPIVLMWYRFKTPDLRSKSVV